MIMAYDTVPVTNWGTQIELCPWWLAERLISTFVASNIIRSHSSEPAHDGFTRERAGNKVLTFMPINSSEV